VALVVYVTVVLLYPVLHRRHHQLHGADHVHTAGGTRWLHVHDPAAVHARFDDDLAAIDLADVAQLGALSVDCGLSAYTLAECDENHPFNFGDALLAHEPSPSPPRDEDPQHGAGSLEHLAVALLTPQVHFLPPPVRPESRVAPAVVVQAGPRPAIRIPTARGPPSFA